MSWNDRLVSLLVEEEEEVAAPVTTKTHNTFGQVWDRKQRARARLKRKKIKKVAGKVAGGAKTLGIGAGVVGGGLLGLYAASNKYLKDNR